ncbi:putative protein [Streptomyces alboniger]
MHAAAWKEMFDAFLRERDGEHFRPFDDTDYDEYVDGRPRADGVRSFLASRNIDLPEGRPDDPPSAPTVQSDSATARTNASWREIRTDGVEAATTAPCAT